MMGEDDPQHVEPGAGGLTSDQIDSPSALDAVFTLFNDDRMLVLELDDQCRIVRCNSGFTRATGYSSDELLNLFPPDILLRPPDKHEEPSNHTAPSRDSYPYLREEQCLCKQANTCTLQWLKLWTCRSGGHRRFVKLGYCHQHASPDPFDDDTASRIHLQAFFDAAPDAIITISDHGTMASVNPATEKLFGYGRAELIGWNVSKLMPDPDRSRHDRYLKNYLDTGEARIIGIGREIVARRKDGSTFPARLSVCEFNSRGQRFFTGMLHDITERVAAENQRREMFAEQAHTSRVVALGEMASSIAHEINQPLAAIVGFADASRKLLESSAGDDESHDYALNQISRQAQRAGDIIRRLRAFVKNKEPDRSSVDINELIKSAAALTEHDAERYGIRLMFELDANSLRALVDGLQIEQVVLNLIRNSVEALYESGNPDGTVKVRSRLNAGGVEVTVTDNGPGIKPSDTERIFETFYTTKKNGTGLGLSISRSIAEAHDGSLAFESKPDQGTIFTLTLPVETTEESP